MTEPDLSARPHSGYVSTEPRFSSRDLKTHRRIDSRVAHISNYFVRQKILLNLFFLEGLQPGEIGLIIGKNAAHQFGIGPIRVRQVSIPGFTEISAPPYPLLLAGDHVVIGDVQHAGLFAMI